MSLVLVSLLVVAAAPASDAKRGGPLGNFKHLVVIYEENHSFDNLYGNWGTVNGQHVIGRSDALAANTTQISEPGNAYTCLKQNDVNLDTDAAGAYGSTLSVQPDCSPEVVTMPVGTVQYTSHFLNEPFNIDDYIGPNAVTCPPLTNLFGFPNGVDQNNPPSGARSGGCTRDLVHKFYQEQYDLNGGAQNRYVTGEDAVGLSMGYYDTTQLPIYGYLHASGAPKYVIADHFFQAAFGGSYLNHQYLIAAQPIHTNVGTVSVLDTNGADHAYPLYQPTGTVVDGTLTQSCTNVTNTLACGDYSVNTSLPYLQPTAGYGPKLPMINDTDPNTPGYELNIGDELSAANVSWAWYAGGWDNAAGITDGPGYTNQGGTTGGSCPDTDSTAAGADGDGANAGWPYCPHRTFQQHHQPFAYFAAYGPGTTGRAHHLLDEQDFFNSAADGTLPAVSFVKPLGEDNEHPGYASEPDGSDHLLDLIQAVMNGPEAGNTLILVTYDEFGGQWDHVSPPGMGANAAASAHDWFGPGTRVPALLVARSFSQSGVDHTYYDTTSILRTIEAQYGLSALSTRDAAVNSLSNMVSTGLRH